MHRHVDHLIVNHPNRVHIWRHAISVLVGIVVLALLPGSFTLASRVAGAWSVAALCQIGLIMLVMGRWNELPLNERIVVASAGPVAFAVLLVVGASVSVAATIWVLRVANDRGPVSETLHLLLGGGTVLVTWFTIQCIFAVRYAHLYYHGKGGDDDGPGLVFPGKRAPDYWDFLYFAICAGMTFQVSDVMTVSRGFRKWVTFHGVLSFLFSTINVALMVDIAANLVGG